MKSSNHLTHLLSISVMAQCLQAQTESSPTTAPADDGVILSASDRDGDFEIYRMKPDGSELTKLTDNPGEDTSPSCSPDGKTIAFVSMRTGSRAVFIMTAEGDVKKIADNAGDATHISWAPDGRRLVCDLQFGRRIDIYVMNADGTEQKELVKEGMMPSWSPDGKTIAFNRGQLPHIYLMDADGANIRPLDVGTSGLPDLSPIWSPNGKTILFTAVAGVEKDNAGEQKMTYEIRTVDADGKNMKSILKTDGMALCWSPEGKSIMLMAGTRDDMDLYTVKSDGTQLTAISKSPSKEMWGCWSHSIQVAPNTQTR